MRINIFDCRDCSAEEIIELMITLNPELNDPVKRRKVYVGVTGNIRERLLRHNVDVALFSAQTANRMVAKKVENIAYEMGFNIGNVSWGGNGTNSHSIYVYACLL